MPCRPVGYFSCDIILSTMIYTGSKQYSRKNGFTIVELLIVIVVIAILAAITIVAYNGIRDRAQESAAKSTTASAAKRVATYAISNAETYPTNMDLVDLGLVDTATTTYQYSRLNNGQGFCMTVKDNNKEFNVSNTNLSPTAGRCSQHTATTITNLAPNPSAETAILGWSSSVNGSTGRLTSGGLYANGMIQITFTTATAGGVYYGSAVATRIPVTAGQPYVASAYLKTNVSSPITISPRIAWYNSSAVEIAAASSAGQSLTINSTDWKRAIIFGTAPAGAVNAAVMFQSPTTVWANNDKQFADGLIFTQGTEVYPYADGTSTGWSWTGTVHASTSTGPSP